MNEEEVTQPSSEAPSIGAPEAQESEPQTSEQVIPASVELDAKEEPSDAVKVAGAVKGEVNDNAETEQVENLKLAEAEQKYQKAKASEESQAEAEFVPGVVHSGIAAASNDAARAQAEAEHLHPKQQIQIS
jgi:hypothetical protein